MLPAQKDKESGNDSDLDELLPKNGSNFDQSPVKEKAQPATTRVSTSTGL